MNTRPDRSSVMGRRSLLLSALGAGVALTSGCTPSSTPSGSTSTPSTNPGSGAPTTTPDPVVNACFSLITAQRGFLASVLTTYPRLSGRGEALLAVHDAHLTLLAELLGDGPAAAPPVAAEIPGTRAAAGIEVGRSTNALIADLESQSVASDQPELARVVASMAAGATQALLAGGWEVQALPAAALTGEAIAGAAEVAALQEALSREHASVWWYGVLGGQTSATANPSLFSSITASYAAHLRQRDILVAALTTASATPVAAEPAYPLRGPVTSPDQIASAARNIEAEATTTYAWVVSQTRAEPRAWAVAALRNAAIRELDFQGTPENFPGADEFADR